MNVKWRSVRSVLSTRRCSVFNVKLGVDPPDVMRIPRMLKPPCCIELVMCIPRTSQKLCSGIVGVIQSSEGGGAAGLKQQPMPRARLFICDNLLRKNLIINCNSRL
ncbi:hypothetical protein IRJ41_010669 [Triplophysa rosa]|uniref:Uncharacterized protein n=1 Tax=Triplophysa rosa TaxID=992332 RepID=A0A9W7TPR2_TRIRA|nr:hypothetical protein IRJ41_010669 [Triplophysa rosa]